MKKLYTDEFKNLDVKYKGDDDEFEIPADKLTDGERKQKELNDKLKRLHDMLDEKYGKNRFKIP